MPNQTIKGEKESQSKHYQTSLFLYIHHHIFIIKLFNNTSRAVIKASDSKRVNPCNLLLIVDHLDLVRGF